MTVNDAAGQPVSWPRMPTRIVSLDPGMTERSSPSGAGGIGGGPGRGQQMPGAAAQVPVASASRPGAQWAASPSLVIADARTPNILDKSRTCAVYITADTGVTGRAPTSSTSACSPAAAPRAGRGAEGARRIARTSARWRPRAVRRSTSTRAPSCRRGRWQRAHQRRRRRRAHRHIGGRAQARRAHVYLSEAALRHAAGRG